jgi:hypothetical protein
MTLLDIGDPSGDRSRDPFPLRAGRQCIAAARELVRRCEPIWRRGRMSKLRISASLIEDESDSALIDDESGARIDND